MAEDKLYRLVNSLSAQVRIIEKTLCANGNIRIPGSYETSGLLCDNSINTEYTDGVYQTIPHPDYIQKVQLCSNSSADVEVVCISNDGGNTIVTGWEVFDTSVTPPVSKIYFNGIDVTGTYVVVPCGNNVTYDYEKVTVCVDGQSWTKVLIFNTTSQPILVNIMWLDNLDNVVPAPDITLIDNANCAVASCNPLITWSYGNNLSTLLESHNFTVTKPSCCDFILNTSIGDIPVIGDFSFITTETFKCTLTVPSIAGYKRPIVTISGTYRSNGNPNLAAGWTNAQSMAIEASNYFNSNTIYLNLPSRTQATTIYVSFHIKYVIA